MTEPRQVTTGAEGAREATAARQEPEPALLPGHWQKRPASSIEQSAAQWAAEQIAAESMARGDLDERTTKALASFLLHVSSGHVQVYGGFDA